MNDTKRIFINTFYQAIGKIITSLLGFVSIFYLTHYFNNTEFSEYSLIFSFATFFAVFPDFGLGTLLTRNIASKKEGENYFANIFTLRLLFCVLILIFLVFLLIFFPYSEKVKLGIIIAFFSNTFLILSSTIWSVFQAETAFKKVVFSQIASSFIALVLVIVGVIFKLPLPFFIIFSVISAIVGFAVSLKLLYFNKYLVYPKVDIFKKIIKESWPFAAGVIMSVAYFKIDSLVLSFFYNPSYKAEVGLYSLSYKLFEVMIVFGGFFTQTLFPFFSENMTSKTFIPNLKRYFNYSIVIAFSASLIIFVFAKPLVLFIAGSKFIDSVFSLQILSFAAGATIISGFFLSVAIAGGKEKTLLKISFVALIVNIIFNLVLIPKYSFIGASWTTVLTQVFIMTSYGWVVIKIVKNNKSC